MLEDDGADVSVAWFTATQYRIVSSRRIHTSTNSRQNPAHTDSLSDAYVDFPRSDAVADENRPSWCWSREGGAEVPVSRDRAIERFMRSVIPSSSARNWRKRSGISGATYL